MQTDDRGASCLTPTYRGLPAGESGTRALLAGTGTWRISDAVRFVAALESGLFDIPGLPSVGSTVLAYMRQPKERSGEPGAVATVSPAWGAGRAFGVSYVGTSHTRPDGEVPRHACRG